GKSHLLQACAMLAPKYELPLTTADDVDGYTDKAQIALFNQFNHLRENTAAGVLIATGAASPMQMNLREDLATRLAWGLVYQLHPLTDEEKALRSEEHTSELQSRENLVCRLLLEKKKSSTH